MMRKTCQCMTACFAVLLLGACGASDDGPGVWDAIDTGVWDSGDDTVLLDTLVDVPTEVPVDDCAERARWVYVVDSGNRFLRFKPDTLTFEDLGTLGCPAAFGETPFSMSVDRDAMAWILFSGALGGAGRIYKADTANPASCTATSFAPNQNGFALFGMGFASNTAGGSEETLFIAGGSALSIGTGDSQFGWIDTVNLIATQASTVPGWPELTGTGSGELWGFFPHGTPSRVHRINKVSGAIEVTYDLTMPTGSTEAWAFAFWGGDFYIFSKLMLDASTNVFKLETDTGVTTEVIHDSGWRIVGAGVSTCAPIFI